jgi:mannose-6-phosphate isomerase-like protein (cupin superfamily)
MLKKGPDVPVQVVNGLRGGTGDVTQTHFLNEQEASGVGRHFARMSLEAGGSIGYHPHNGEAEIYYFLSGTGLLNDNGAEAPVEPGDSHICPDGCSHGIKHTGDGPLEFIALILYTGLRK